MNSSSLIQSIRNWPTRRHLAVLGGTLVAIGLLMGFFETTDPDSSAARTTVIGVDLPQRESTPDSGVPEPAAPAIEPAAMPPKEAGWTSVTVRPGQTLDAIFRQQGFSVTLLHRILALNADTQGLKRIRPGDTFDFKRHDDGELSRMRYELDEANYLLVVHENGEVNAEKLARQLTRTVHEAEGVIRSSLFLAAKQAGLRDGVIMELATIFGWDIDFVLDIRGGDHFMVVYEKIERDGEFLRDGNILAATFINQGQRYQAVRFESDGVAEYFAPDGRNMKKAFLRAPLNFSYISSGFNPRRMHPVLKRIRPHNGIDYYAPRGTPVYAAGRGKVTRSAYSKTNGHHVFIRHDGGVVTKYLHFSRRAVREGQNVRQGQTIGYVGSTGLATGPHLHYEFVVNGVHRNPRTVPLPKVEPLKGELLTEFQAHAAPFLTRLSRLESASMYAGSP